MVLLGSATALFISTTMIATVLTVLAFGRPPIEFIALLYAGYVSLVTLPTYVLLMVAAGLGRRRPVLDGILLVAVIGLVICGLGYASMLNSDDSITRSYSIFLWWGYFGGLASIVPAHLISYFALRRTPLLRGLAPPSTTKEPAEAGS